MQNVYLYIKNAYTLQKSRQFAIRFYIQKVRHFMFRDINIGGHSSGAFQRSPPLTATNKPDHSESPSRESISSHSSPPEETGGADQNPQKISVDTRRKRPL